MALISFGYRVDMYAIDPPTDPASFIVAYDLDGVLKQKDYQGVVTLIGVGAGGPQGPPGPVGPAGLTWSGSWIATASYSQNYAVGYASASWWCISDIIGATSNVGPDLDTTHWALLAAQGSPGSQGSQGVHGNDGPQGEIGINWLGQWIINVYYPRDAVYDSGSSYVCILNTIGSETINPGSNPSCWSLIALKGSDGLQGATGSDGLQGATGPQGPAGLTNNVFFNIGTTISATNSTSSIYRTGSINIGSGTATNGRFVVSSSGGTVSLVVDEFGNVYNNGNGGIATNTAFGASALSINVGGYNNTAIGVNALLSNISGFSNTTIGVNALLSNTSGSFNTAIGDSSLYSNTTGYTNTAIGDSSLYSNTTGYTNTAIGHSSLYNNTTGNSNIAIGNGSLYSNTSGNENTAIGANTLYFNTTGYYNTAIGLQSLYNNTTGNENTAIGANTLLSNTTGQINTAIGHQSLRNNSIGGTNTAVGSESLRFNTTGSANTAIGNQTLFYNETGSYNTIVGNGSLFFNTTGSYNIGIGSQAGVYRVSFLGATNSNNSIFIGSDTTSGATTSNATNEIVIGHSAAGNGSNTITLGNNSIVTTYLKGNVQLPTVPTTSAGTYSILTRNDITGEVEKIVVTPYKVYTALLTQSGTASPTAIVLENTLGQVPTFGYNTIGNYNINVTGNIFTNNKTFVSITAGATNEDMTLKASSLVSNSVSITRHSSGVPADGSITNASIEIRVYN